MAIYNEIARRQIVLAGLDGTTNAGPTSGIWVPAAGDVVVVLADDDLATTTTFTAVPAGTYLPICVKKWVSGPAGCIGLAT